ncbi:Protein of unknown function [Virgibacillus subterraneus]|uniref:DUF3231 family protein n=2 Tax=Virgibacillus TaxID=84406 RepID=A0A1H1EYD6_9BACI|nr:MULTISPECIES: DUF3231 family protein [Virgibacillus]SDQ93671.1 Protein of unknown function [Virgibacillus salinus]SEQ94637.1 Protein of unknown function [Virgibacillus subterraneus]
MTTQANLTASEVANLWSAYNDNAATIIKMKYVLAIMEDNEIRPIAEKTQQFAEQNIEQIKQIYENEDHAVPVGFTDADVDLTAPRLFADTFFLVFLQNKFTMNLTSYTMGLTHSTRSDIRDFFTQCIDTSEQIYNETTDLMLSKGIYARSPFIPVPKTVDTIERQNFLTGWLGNRRPLTAIEIDQLFFNIQRNAIGHALLIGFSQVAKAKEVREYMRRGADIAEKHIKVFNSVLTEEDLPSSMIWSSNIEETTVSPFSDKLLMYEVAGTTQAGVGYYGQSLASAQRRDLGSHYMRVLGESLEYGEDGANITIKHAWLEEPPQAVDRRRKI